MSTQFTMNKVYYRFLSVNVSSSFIRFFCQWLLHKESSWQATMEQVKDNKRFIDGCFSCIHEGLLEVLPRLGNQPLDLFIICFSIKLQLLIFSNILVYYFILGTWKELPLDRWKIMQHMALFIFSTYASGKLA